jgi:hypothetical protein
MRSDPTTPDTRLADDPLRLNPCTVASLIHLMLGGIHPRKEGAPLHCRVRYFDPKERRAGLPPDVAALVEKLDDTTTTLALVNLNQLDAGDVIVQAGAYAEHTIVSASVEQPIDMKLGLSQDVAVDGPTLRVHLEPGCGGRLKLTMKRYSRQPTLSQPWDTR